MVKVDCALEQINGTLRFKEPKTRHSFRTISLPPKAVEVLRDHRRRQLELRLALGQGKPELDALVFRTIDGNPLSP
jgi:hypothetical protein